MRISDWSSDVCSSDLNHSSLSGVTGSSRMRLPVAWKLALAMAGGTHTVAISQTPLTPSGLTCGSCSSTKITSMTGVREDRRRIGRQFVRIWRSRWYPHHYKKTIESVAEHSAYA